MWRQLVERDHPEATFVPGVSEQALSAAEATLGHALPVELVALLKETDGVKVDYGLDLLWPLARIVEENRSYRTSPSFSKTYMPLAPLTFFTDDGCGNGFALLSPPLTNTNIFVWNAIEDSRINIASDLASFLSAWANGGFRY